LFLLAPARFASAPQLTSKQLCARVLRSLHAERYHDDWPLKSDELPLFD
jgi:hypothetical protein